MRDRRELVSFFDVLETLTPNPKTIIERNHSPKQDEKPSCSESINHRFLKAMFHSRGNELRASSRVRISFCWCTEHRTPNTPNPNPNDKNVEPIDLSCSCFFTTFKAYTKGRHNRYTRLLVPHDQGQVESAHETVRSL